VANWESWEHAKVRLDREARDREAARNAEGLTRALDRLLRYELLHLTVLC
jgi:hypothetical protein